MRHIGIVLEFSDGQKYLTLEDISKYFINLGFLMAFAIFNINDFFWKIKLKIKGPFL